MHTPLSPLCCCGRYPFSTREQVNIARHLQAFPLDTIGRAVANVVSFDAMDHDVTAVLRETFAAHGVSIQASAQVHSVDLPVPRPLAQLPRAATAHPQVGG